MEAIGIITARAAQAGTHVLTIDPDSGITSPPIIATQTPAAPVATTIVKPPKGGIVNPIETVGLPIAGGVGILVHQANQTLENAGNSINNLPKTPAANTATQNIDTDKSKHSWFLWLLIAILAVIVLIRIFK